MVLGAESRCVCVWCGAGTRADQEEVVRVESVQQVVAAPVIVDDNRRRAERDLRRNRAVGQCQAPSPATLEARCGLRDTIVGDAGCALSSLHTLSRSARTQMPTPECNTSAGSAHQDSWHPSI